MGEQFRSLLDEFDFILIDCPPGLTLFSEAAIRAADGLIIPTLPNEISFAAIDHLRTEIARAPRPLVSGFWSAPSYPGPSWRGGLNRQQTETMERLLDRVARNSSCEAVSALLQERKGRPGRTNDTGR
jgi:hypothetical protein